MCSQTTFSIPHWRMATCSEWMLLNCCKHIWYSFVVLIFFNIPYTVLCKPATTMFNQTLLPQDSPRHNLYIFQIFCQLRQTIDSTPDQWMCDAEIIMSTIESGSTVLVHASETWVYPPRTKLIAMRASLRGKMSKSKSACENKAQSKHTIKSIVKASETATLQINYTENHWTQTKLIWFMWQRSIWMNSVKDILNIHSHQQINLQCLILYVLL